MDISKCKPAVDFPPTLGAPLICTLRHDDCFSVSDLEIRNVNVTWVSDLPSSTIITMSGPSRESVAFAVRHIDLKRLGDCLK